VQLSVPSVFCTASVNRCSRYLLRPGTAFALTSVTTLARISGLYLGGRRFPYVSAGLSSWRLNVRYKPGYISKRRLLEEASRDSRFVLTRVATNISAFGVMTPCILVDGRAFHRKLLFPPWQPSPECRSDTFRIVGFYHFIINHQTVIISHVHCRYDTSSSAPPLLPPTLTHGHLMLFRWGSISVFLHMYKEVQLGFRSSTYVVRTGPTSGFSS